MISQAVAEGVVDAMTGNPDPALLPDLIGAFAFAADAPPARYGDALVHGDLAEVARANLEADGLPPDHLTVVSGSMDAVERILLTRLRPGDRVGVEDPGYASVLELVRGLGFVPVPVEIDREGLRSEALEGALASGLHALVVTPRAHNPTGAAFSHRRVRALDAILSRHPDVLVLQDDHGGAISGVDLVALSCDRPRWAVARSVAKSLGPDLRTAVLVGDSETVNRVEGRLQLGPGWVSHMLQRAVAHLLVDDATQRALRDAAAIYTHRRAAMIAALAGRGIGATGSSGLHVWVPVPEESVVVSGLRDRGFAVRAGRPYRLASGPAVRVTTAALAEQTIEDLADALADVLDPASATSQMA